MREELWACEPTFLSRYLETLENATAEDRLKAQGMFGDPDDDKDDDETDGTYEEDGDEARIKIEGPLSMERPSPLAHFFGFGGTSYQSIIAACNKAEASACNRVHLQINSPGGEVAGCDQVWQAVSAMKKNCVAENHGLCASGAYWIASGAPKIVAMSPACEQGSIGVVHVGIDDSGAGDKLGIKRVVITSRNAPEKDQSVSTKIGRSAMQRRADEMESVFAARVAQGRKTTVDNVLENYGKGNVLISSRALAAGMIDEVRTRVESLSVPDNSSRRMAADVPPFWAPLPNFHSCRIATPNGEKTRYAKGERKHEGKSYDVIYQKKKGSDSWEEQAYRYPKGSWNADTASSHCKSHKGRFEAARSGGDDKGKSVLPGGQNMKLAEFLSDNPEARVELEKLVTDARTEGVKSIQSRIDAAKPFLSLMADEKNGYGAAEIKQIQKAALDVITGVDSEAGLRSFVRLVDMQIESRKQGHAQAETAALGETQPVKLEANAEIMARAVKVGIDAVRISQIEAACKAAKTDPLQAVIGEIEMLEAAAKSKVGSSVRGL